MVSSAQGKNVVPDWTGDPLWGWQGETGAGDFAEAVLQLGWII